MLSVMEWAKKHVVKMATRQIAKNSAVDGGEVGWLGSPWGIQYRFASVLLLTEATMTEIPKAKKEQTLGPEMAM